MVAAGVVSGSLLLGWWRWHHNSWLTTIYAAIVAVLALAVAVLVLGRATTRQDRRAGDVMLLGGIAPLTIAAAAAPPGPVGSPQALLGFAVLTVAAAEAAIGLAIVVIYFRNRGSIQVEDVNLMKG